MRMGLQDDVVTGGWGYRATAGSHHFFHRLSYNFKKTFRQLFTEDFRENFPVGV